MMGLSESERISMIHSAVLIQYTHVTDRQTDGIGVAYTRHSIYAVARKSDVNLISAGFLIFFPSFHVTHFELYWSHIVVIPVRRS